MKYLDDEKLVIESNNSIIQVTNKRVIYNTTKFGKKNYTSIFLKRISSIELEYKSKPLYIILSALFFIAGLFLQVDTGNNQFPYFLYGIILALIFIVWFFVSRKHFLVISSFGNEGNIKLQTKGLSKESLESFIYELESTINKII